MLPLYETPVSKLYARNLIESTTRKCKHHGLPFVPGSSKDHCETSNKCKVSHTYLPAFGRKLGNKYPACMIRLVVGMCKDRTYWSNGREDLKIPDNGSP